MDVSALPYLRSMCDRSSIPDVFEILSKRYVIDNHIMHQGCKATWLLQALKTAHDESLLTRRSLAQHLLVPSVAAQHAYFIKEKDIMATDC